MQKILLFAFLAAMTFFISACKTETYVLNAATVMASVTQLDKQLALVSIQLDKNKGVFTNAEQLQLTLLQQELKSLHSSSQFLTQSGGSVLLKFDQIQSLFTKAKAVYAEARLIIKPKLKQLPIEVQADMILFDKNAKRLNESIITLLSTPGADVTQAVSDVLTLGATAARLAQLAI